METLRPLLNSQYYARGKNADLQGRALAYGLFIQESFRTIRTTASIVPSSRFLAMAMLEQVDFRNARILVELGSGTGVMTQEILRRMTHDSHLFALEINANFVRHLRRTCPDRRLTVLHADASDLLNQLRMHKADVAHAVISSLGLTNMSQEGRERIITDAQSCLASSGVLTQYQYLNPVQPLANLPRLNVRPFQGRQFLRGYFPSVHVKRVLLNFPPAEVFTCRK